MTARGIAILLLVSALGGGHIALGQTSAPPPTAAEILAGMRPSGTTSGFVLRTRLVRTAPGLAKPEVQQMLIKGRRVGDTFKVLCQILWPPAVKGRALYTEVSSNRTMSGFIFEPPDTVTPLTPEKMSEPLFGSDVSVGDMAEDFWQWPGPVVAGEETVDKRACRIIEFHAPAGASTNCLRVKVWISPDVASPLRVEKFRADGQLMTRISAQRLVKQSTNRLAVATRLVEIPARQSRVVIETTGGSGDADVPEVDFTLEKIKGWLHDDASASTHSPGRSPPGPE